MYAVAFARSSSACLCLCALLACNDSPRTSSSDASSGMQPSTSVVTNAGAGGESREAAADSGTPSAAPSGGPSAPGAAGARADTGSAGKPAAAGAAGDAPAEPVPDAGAQDAATPDAQTPAESCGPCEQYAEPKAAGMVAVSELSALSGLAISRSQPDILFAHNDHDRPVVYALDLQGQLHARITLQAEATDIEDIAVGKCDTNICVYLADVGDNSARRDEYAVLRFVEPTVPSAPGDEQQSPMFERLRFRYDDGSHNAESFFVGPNGNMYVLTKLAPGNGGNVDATGPSSVYRIDANAFARGGVATATKVATLPVPMSGEAALSAAAAHPCGLGFLARTYDRVYEFRVPPSAADFEAAFAATPLVVAEPDEMQSEGIDYLADGRGFVSSGEGRSAPLMLTQCVR